MKSSSCCKINTLATGFFVLVFFSILLFWAKLLCDFLLVSMMPGEAKGCWINPSGIVPSEFENDSNVVSHSRFNRRLNSESFLLSMGFVDFFTSRTGLFGRSGPLQYYDNGNWTFYDSQTGLIQDCSAYKVEIDDGKRNIQTKLYIGPEGISEKPEKALGKFKEPVVSGPKLSTKEPLPLVIYDRIHRRFYLADLKAKNITCGPQLSKDDKHQPIQLKLIIKGQNHDILSWMPPQIRVPDESVEREHIAASNRMSPQIGLPDEQEPKSPGRLQPVTPFISPSNHISSTTRYIHVLDASGQIDLLDIETLTFAGIAGYLPTPEGLFPSQGRARPEDMLAFNAIKLEMMSETNWQSLKDPEKRKALTAEEKYSKYLGMAVVATSREGTSQALAVFDPNGKRVEYQETQLWERSYRGEHRRGAFASTSSAKAALFARPWAPVVTICKYLTENLHPPVLSIASFFLASTFEAGSGYRAIFFQPNSFLAAKGRHTTEHIVYRTFGAIWFILPAFFFSILLTIAVTKDARKRGLSKRSILFWRVVTLALGLPAYITYRLTRLRITLVTCSACGQLRRPDQQRCHRCNSAWERPDLSAPTWRIIAS